MTNTQEIIDLEQQFVLQTYKRPEFVLARGHVARVDALHAPLAQRLELVEAVNMMRCQLTIDRNLQCVQTK